MTKKTTCVFLLSLVATLYLAGCSTTKKAENELYANPAPNAGFIADPGQDTHHADLPFNREWIKPGFKLMGYNSLIIAPVDTTHMLKMNWWQQANLRSVDGQFPKDFKDIANYMHDSFTKAFNYDKKQRFVVVTQPNGHTLTLEMALIELVPSKPVLNALGWLQMGGGTAASVISPRTVAFEARLRDAQTGEIVATFADREKQESDPLDLTRLTWYEPAKQIINEWAKQMVAVANRKPGEVISKSVPFSLMPW